MASHLLPSGAYDTHVHVFDKRLGSYAAGRSYTPGEASRESLLEFESGVSVTGKPCNIVIVQASPYKNDNGVLLATLESFRREGIKTARGIAVFDSRIVTDEELQFMHELGVRGLRLNVQSDSSGVDVGALEEAMIHGAERIKNFPGWKLQLYAPSSVWDYLYPVVSKLPVPVIADHFAGLKALSKLPQMGGENNSATDEKLVLTQPGLEAVVRLAEESRLIIKLSGFYRASNSTADCYLDLAPIVRYLAKKVPGQLIWGSDWPHTGEAQARDIATAAMTIEHFQKIDDEGILRNLREWLGSDNIWHKVMVENPRLLYE